MALTTVQGVYRDGQVELSERPAGISEAPVLVVFLPMNGAGKRSGAPQDERSDDREAARQRAFARMRAGIPLGGPPYPTREELHDRGRR